MARGSELSVPEHLDGTRAAQLDRSTGGKAQARGFYGALLVALAIGTLIRAWHTWSADFPLNDGGLFYIMVRDLQQAHYQLPTYTSYNAEHIPFAYSPFAFYLTGLLNDATGASLLTLLRVLPFVASTACIVAFALLARAMLASRTIIAVALVAFAIVPRGFVWLIMGGGLTRSFGYLFALLALYWIWLLYTRRSLRYVPLAAVCCALTVSSHLGTAPFVAFSAALFLLFRGRHREGVVGSLLIGAGTLLLTAPWWATVIAMHGLAPFAAARATGGSLISAADSPGGILVLGRAVLGTTGEGLFPLILILALLGAIWCVRKRRALLPVWWVSILVLDARAGSTYAAAPVAMLAGICVIEVLWPLVATAGERASRRSVYQRAALLVSGVLLCGSIVSAASSRAGIAGETRVLSALTPVDRAAMQWLALHTSPAARVLVLTSVPWEIDKASEWLPALSQRVSVATVQGTEWLPHGAFEQAIQRRGRLAACADAATSCLDSLRLDPALRFTQVYVPNGPSTQCCRPLLSALRRDSRYRAIYDGDGATIFAWR